MIHVFWSLRRFVIKFPLHKNIDKKKIIISIQRLEKNNEYIKYEDKIGGLGTNKTLSFIIKDDTLIVSWSHLYYDMYSIKFVLSKIDDVYHDKIKTFTFKYYKHDFYQFVKDDIHIFKNIKHMCKDAFHVHHCDKKKIIKIPKNKLKLPISSSEIFKYILNELNIDEYNITVNLRRIYPEYHEQLGMLSCLPAVIKKNDDLQYYLKKLSRKTLEENLLNNYQLKSCITSLLNMKVPSFIDEKKIVKDVCDIKYYKETIIVLPENTDEKYIRAVYLH
jgi:hypothetical protein